jgi:hypothetical protein
MARRNLLKLR